MKQRLRTAILGCGGFAQKHAQVLTQLNGDLELVGFADRNLERAQAFAQQYTGGRAQTFSHHHDLLEQAELDLLLITLPPFGHSDEVEVAAAMGLHIFNSSCDLDNSI